MAYSTSFRQRNDMKPHSGASVLLHRPSWTRSTLEHVSIFTLGAVLALSHIVNLSEIKRSLRGLPITFRRSWIGHDNPVSRTLRLPLREKITKHAPSLDHGTRRSAPSFPITG
ncbi:hypothetical protein RSAG8_13083, partial [Rhizoctonia solani AG-8 WAC10335]